MKSTAGQACALALHGHRWLRGPIPCHMSINKHLCPTFCNTKLLSGHMYLTHQRQPKPRMGAGGRDSRSLYTFQVNLNPPLLLFSPCDLETDGIQNKIKSN